MQEDRTAIRVSKVFGRILCYVNDTKQASTLIFTASGTGEVIKYPASSTIAHKVHRHLHNLITPWITKRYDMLFLNEHTFYFVSIDGTWSLMFDVFVCWLCGVMDEKRKTWKLCIWATRTKDKTKDTRQETTYIKIHYGKKIKAKDVLRYGESAMTFLANIVLVAPWNSVRHLYLVETTQNLQFNSIDDATTIRVHSVKKFSTTTEFPKHFTSKLFIANTV